MAERARGVTEVRTGTGREILSVLLLSALCWLPVPVRAESGQAAIEAGRLERIRAEITGLKQELGTVRGRHASEQQELERIDREIDTISKALRATERDLDGTRRQLAELQAERDTQQAGLKRMRARLLRELRASYMESGERRVRLLLSQEDPADLGRMLVYQGYLARARSERIDAVRAVLDGLRETGRKLDEQHSRMATLHDEQQAGVEQLHSRQVRQQELVTALQRELDQGNERLTALEADRQRVSRLLEELRRVFEDVPYVSGPDKPLRQLKGRLTWPVAGRISMPYGATQAGGKMRTRGVHIATRSGTEVHAIARGRIAFADWLRGFGLLTIIDHGDGYMSLYGENSSLYKSVGEWVERGAVIAAAGNSGGQQRTGIYLELRKDGQPVDPGRWFQGKPPVQKESGGRDAAG